MAVTQPDTRSRILDAAWQLFRERGPGSVTLAEVGRAGKVSRQAVYLHFDSRAGLLLAMAKHHDHRAGFIGRVVATRSLPPAEGLAELIRTWCHYIPDILPVARALEAASITGDTGGDAWDDRMNELREAYRIAVARCADHGLLTGGWTVQTATDWVWARSHLSTLQHLVHDCGWSIDDYVERQVRSILAEILQDS